MKIPRKGTAAFTLAEMTVAAAVSIVLSLGILLYSSSALRMTARNLSTNHSHETARGALERLLSQVHNSAGRFQLVNYDGTTYSDFAATVSSDQDAYSQQYVSGRANGVRFMVMAGGPFKLTGNGTDTTGAIAATDTTLQFEFGTSSYVPVVGDKVQIPLLSREFDITALSHSGTKWTATISTAIGSSLITQTGTTPTGQAWTNPTTTGIFYHRVAYTVWNNQLRYHPNFPSLPYPTTATDTVVLVKKNVTSPKPFGLLFPTAAATITDALNLRVSLESYDLDYSARLFMNGATTLQAIIPSRNQPPILSSN